MGLRDLRRQHHRSAASSRAPWENLSPAVSHYNQHNYLLYLKSNYKLTVAPLSHSKRRFTRGTKGPARPDEQGSGCFFKKSRVTVNRCHLSNQNDWLALPYGYNLKRAAFVARARPGLTTRTRLNRSQRCWEPQPAPFWELVRDAPSRKPNASAVQLKIKNSRSLVDRHLAAPCAAPSGATPEEFPAVLRF